MPLRRLGACKGIAAVREAEQCTVTQYADRPGLRPTGQRNTQLLPRPVRRLGRIASEQALGDGATDEALDVAAGEVAEVEGSVVLIISEAAGEGDETADTLRGGRAGGEGVEQAAEQGEGQQRR